MAAERAPDADATTPEYTLEDGARDSGAMPDQWPAVARLTADATTPGLPRGESSARDEICDALASAIVWLGELADAANEPAVLDIRRDRHVGEDDGSLTVRALLRLLTTNGADADYRTDLDEMVERTWRRVGRALAAEPRDQRAAGDEPDDDESYLRSLAASERTSWNECAAILSVLDRLASIEAQATTVLDALESVAPGAASTARDDGDAAYVAGLVADVVRARDETIADLEAERERLRDAIETSLAILAGGPAVANAAVPLAVRVYTAASVLRHSVSPTEDTAND